MRLFVSHPVATATRTRQLPSKADRNELSTGGKDRRDGAAFSLVPEARAGRRAPHLRVAAHRVVQVQVSSYDVQLDSQQNHQHAGAVHAHDGAGETWTTRSTRS